MRAVFLILSLCFIFQNLNGQIGRLALSPVQKIEQVIGLTDISLVYSRPSKRGRDIFGGLVPYDKMWRTGANRNTTIEFSKDTFVGDIRLTKGKYAIFTKPSLRSWDIFFYKKTDNWNVPDSIDVKQVAAQITVPSYQGEKDLEVLSISIGDFTNYNFNLNIAWEQTSVSVPFTLITKELMDKKIERILSGPSYQDYYAAAEYQMESAKDYELGLVWINKAIEITDEVTWWDLRIKANLLIGAGRRAEAKKIAEQGMEMAKAVNREYGIREFKIILEKL